MRYMGDKKFALLTSIYLLLCAHSSAFAECTSEKQAAEQEAEQVSAQMQGANGCKASKLTIRILEINIEYLDKCKTADPDGSIRQAIKVSLAGAKETANTVCS